MRQLFARIAIGLALVAPQAARADIILAQSLFTTGAEGWVLGDFYLKSVVPNQSSLSWHATGGNPGGFIGTNGDALAPSSVEAFFAPAAFLGDQSAAFGGTLSFTIQALLGITPNEGLSLPMLAISDGTLSLQYRSPLPGLAWTSYNIPMKAGAGWEVSGADVNMNDNGPRPAATDAQLLQVLSHLTFMSIREDMRGGDDQTNLDNVVLSATTVTPEPGTLSLLAGGIVVLGVVGKRRQRRGISQS